MLVYAEFQQITATNKELFALDKDGNVWKRREAHGWIHVRGPAVCPKIEDDGIDDKDPFGT